MNYRKINNLSGWLAGGIALIVYLMTLEPTVSFWDCGEFLSCAYKLEVGHSPGAPLFMMLQRMFGIFVDKQHAAMAINSFSALVSALTIVFLFWTITYFAKKMLVGKNVESPEKNQTLLIMGAGFVGALAYTFSDTFWFSAVEAEVYATSSFVTAISFWAALKWEAVADEKHADKWLLLIAYMVGLSVGIHLLNLLIIPAVIIIYYFRRYNVTKMGTFAAFIIGCAILGFVQFGVLQGIPILAFAFDKLFVNSFGLPFDIGAIFLVLLIIALLVWLLLFAKKKGHYLLHTGVLCIMFIIIGFSCYIVPVLRSRADTTIDMTNPDDANRLLSYVNREQFGSQPLLFGPDFNSPMTKMEKTGDTYAATKKGGKDQYVIVGKKQEPVFDRTRFFPRIWEYNQGDHAQFYKQYLGLSDNEEATSADNFKFFMGYQMNWMWWRYFMWNYSGRQNDWEGQGEAKNGNWITGIKALDKMKVGDLDKMPDNYRDNKARNQLYLLPFILGVLGLIYQFNRDKRNGFIVFLLFFFTGIAIGIYLNMPPLQPRERDYAFAGSTYAFAIWIGLGVLMVQQWFRKMTKDPIASVAAIGLCLIAVPTLMASEEWDDHDRSKKTLARATAYNALMSCDSNAILFTFGDNDTYPLWYLQEVEGIRTDVRTINTSLLGIDWYIDQLNYKVNDADAVPMIWERDKYIGDRSNILYYVENPRIPKDKFFNIEEICKFMTDDNPENKQAIGDGLLNYMPTKNFFINSLNKEQLVQNGLIKAADSSNVTTEVKFTWNKQYLTKDQVAIMNIIAGIAKQGWKRPICFAAGLPGDNYLNLGDYMRMDGVVVRLMPFKYTDSTTLSMPNRGGDQGFVNLDKCLELYMKTYQWGNAQRKDVYFDEKNRLMFYAYRTGVARIAENLTMRGRNAEAIQILDKVMDNISEESMQYDRLSVYIAMAYTSAGAKEKGRNLALKITKNLEDDINWILSLNDNQKAAEVNSLKEDAYFIYQISQSMTALGDPATGKELQDKANLLGQKIQANMGGVLQ